MSKKGNWPGPSKPTPQVPSFLRAVPGLLIAGVVLTAAVVFHRELASVIGAVFYLLGKLLGFLFSLPALLLDVIMKAGQRLFG